MKNVLCALEEWFLGNCDGDWEHCMGITIETLDNPGWAVKIYLIGTALEERRFEKIEVEHDESNWIYCRVEQGFFKGFGGPQNLRDILSIFLEWAASHNGDREPRPT